jgi:hypothetical protein
VKLRVTARKNRFTAGDGSLRFAADDGALQT